MKYDKLLNELRELNRQGLLPGEIQDHMSLDKNNLEKLVIKVSKQYMKYAKDARNTNMIVSVATCLDKISLEIKYKECTK